MIDRSREVVSAARAADSRACANLLDEDIAIITGRINRAGSAEIGEVVIRKAADARRVQSDRKRCAFRHSVEERIADAELISVDLELTVAQTCTDFSDGKCAVEVRLRSCTAEDVELKRIAADGIEVRRNFAGAVERVVVVVENRRPSARAAREGNRIADG